MIYKSCAFYNFGTNGAPAHKWKHYEKTTKIIYLAVSDCVLPNFC